MFIFTTILATLLHPEAGPTFAIGESSSRISGFVANSSLLIARRRDAGSDTCSVWVGRESGLMVRCILRLKAVSEWNVQQNDVGYKFGESLYAVVWTGAVTRNIVHWQRNSTKLTAVPVHTLEDDPITLRDGVICVASSPGINAPARLSIFALTQHGLKWFAWPRGFKGVQPGSRSCYLLGERGVKQVHSITELKEALKSIAARS